MTRLILLASLVAQLGERILLHDNPRLTYSIALCAPVDSNHGIPTHNEPRLVNPAYAAEAKSLWGYNSDDTNTLTKRLVNPAYADKAKELWGYDATKDKRQYDTDQTGPAASEETEDDFTGYHVPGAKRSLGIVDSQDGWIDYSKLYDAPSAINPIYQNLSKDHELYKRADSGPLYGTSGKPDYEDVHQSECFFPFFPVDTQSAYLARSDISRRPKSAEGKGGE
jgi:hypothetical protein